MKVSFDGRNLKFRYVQFTQNFLFTEFNQRGMDAVTKGPYPFDYVLWHPNVSFIKSEILYKFLAVLFHWIPALLIDCILPIFGQKPM